MQRRSGRSTFSFSAGVQENVSMEMVDHPQVGEAEDSWQWWDRQKSRQNDRATGGGNRQKQRLKEKRRKPRALSREQEPGQKVNVHLLMWVELRPWPLQSSILEKRGIMETVYDITHIYTSINTKLLVVGVMKGWKPAATLSWSLRNLQPCLWNTAATYTVNYTVITGFSMADILVFIESQERED